MRIGRHLALLLLALTLGACGQAPLPEDHFYRLRVSEPQRVLSHPRLDGTLQVERFVADGLTAGRPIVYSLADNANEVREYNYHLWTERPTMMLRDQLVFYLRAAKIAKVVVTPEMRVDADYALTGRIIRLERIVGEPMRAAVELEFSLRRTKDDKLLFLNTYSAETKAADDSVGAAVTALNQALTQIYTRFTADLANL